jgi:hypothetical protein
MPASTPSTSNPGPFGKLLNAIGAVFRALGILVRRMPIVVVFVVVLGVVSYRQYQQPDEEPLPQFDDPEMIPKEAQPPSDLPPGTNPSLWTCVQRVDSQLSNGLWADVYFGMEAQLDGKVVTIKVTEKWRELSDDKRKTVAQLVVDTWLENGKALHLLKSGDELDEIIIKRLPEDETVATWRPSTGVLLTSTRVGA